VSFVILEIVAGIVPVNWLIAMFMNSMFTKEPSGGSVPVWKLYPMLRYLWKRAK
jgi:hypothetical protein